eukprot:1196430-Prorocentrum_minimum.AAC.5
MWQPRQPYQGPIRGGRHINQSEIDTCTLGSTRILSTVRSNPMCRQDSLCAHVVMFRNARYTVGSCTRAA